MSGSFSPGPWEYVPSNEHHGPYIAGPYGGDIADCYAMSNPQNLSVRNGGDSKPIPFQGDLADANARLIAAAPELYEALAEYMECVGIASDPALHQADVITLHETRERMVRAQKIATAALAKARGDQ